jgi:alkylated DNA repair dioxygenase AlkB
MDCYYYKNPSPHIILKNVFNFKEIVNVKKEIEKFKPLFTKNSKYLESAKSKDENILRTGSGFFLSKTQHTRFTSSIMRYCYEKFQTPSFASNFEDIWVQKLYNNLSSGAFLLNRYREGEEYKKHHDNTIFTLVLCFKEDCSGGEFFLGDNELTIDLDDNDGIVFIGTEFHGVKPITKGERYSLSIFMR